MIMKTKHQSPKTFGLAISFVFILCALNILRRLTVLDETREEKTSAIDVPTYEEETPDNIQGGAMERAKFLEESYHYTLDNFLLKGVRQKPKPQSRFLLDFVVAGFAKCGTSSLNTLLASHPSIQETGNEEDHYFLREDNITIIHRLYEDLFLPTRNRTNRSKILKGFKCPHHIQSEKVLNLMAALYTNTKMIISVRHPVLWFQSYYNYRVTENETELLMGSPNELIGELKCSSCTSDKAPWLLSTAAGEFHRFLAALKKTPLSDPDELNLLKPFTKPRWNITGFPKNPNAVFFCALAQLEDKNESRSSVFRRDLQHFLHLDKGFSIIPHQKRKRDDIKSTAKINICKEQFLPVRNELMNIARNASLWLRNYFMRGDNVFFSSEDFLIDALMKWMVDPCIHT
mmetsp:Transcript_13995/g.26197  ORF Transcript_13995/g.26197 Transcript_13995/m.26197 type:complete len:402 (+) Transcript_13995:257-1462(+)